MDGTPTPEAQTPPAPSSRESERNTGELQGLKIARENYELMTSRLDELAKRHDQQAQKLEQVMAEMVTTTKLAQNLINGLDEQHQHLIAVTAAQTKIAQTMAAALEVLEAEADEASE